MIENDESILHLLLKSRKLRDKYSNDMQYFVIQDYEEIGANVLDSLIDLLISEGDLYIPNQIKTIQSRVWNSTY